MNAGSIPKGHESSKPGSVCVCIQRSKANYEVGISSHSGTCIGQAGPGVYAVEVGEGLVHGAFSKGCNVCRPAGGAGEFVCFGEEVIAGGESVDDDGWPFGGVDSVEQGGDDGVFEVGVVWFEGEVDADV